MKSSILSSNSKQMSGISVDDNMANCQGANAEKKVTPFGKSRDPMQLKKTVQDLYAEVGLESPAEAELAVLAKVMGEIDKEGDRQKEIDTQDLEEHLLEVIRSCPPPSPFGQMAEVAQLRQLYFRYNQPGALRKPGAAKELADYPVLRNLLAHGASTSHMRESQAGISARVYAKGLSGLESPGKNRGNSLARTPQPPKVHTANQARKNVLSPQNLLAVKVGLFAKTEAAELLAGPHTPTAYRIFAQHLLKEVPLGDLKFISKEDLALSVAAGLQQAQARGEVESRLTPKQLDKIGVDFATALSTHVGVVAYQCLGEKIIAHYRVEKERLMQQLPQVTDSWQRERLQNKLEHVERVLDRLMTRGQLNPLAAMDDKLFSDFPLLAAETMQELGIGGGLEGNILQTGIKDYQTWKQSTDKVYFVLADMVKALYGSKVPDAVGLGISAFEKMMAYRRREAEYTREECLGRAIVDVAVEYGVSKMAAQADQVIPTALEDSGLINDLAAGTLASYINFLHGDIRKKAAENILGN